MKRFIYRKPKFLGKHYFGIQGLGSLTIYSNGIALVLCKLGSIKKYIEINIDVKKY